jgi:hypothetical protein
VQDEERRPGRKSANSERPALHHPPKPRMLPRGKRKPQLAESRAAGKDREPPFVIRTLAGYSDGCEPALSDR